MLFADAFPPAVHAVVERVGWVPTLELTVHVRRRPVAGWVQARLECDDVAGGWMVETGTLWDESGAVVAAVAAARHDPRPRLSAVCAAGRPGYPDDPMTAALHVDRTRSWPLDRRDGLTLAGWFLGMVAVWWAVGALITGPLDDSWFVRTDESISRWFADRRTPTHGRPRPGRGACSPTRSSRSP